MASAITAKIVGGNLVVTIALTPKDKSLLSKGGEGKNLIRASSGGFQDVGDGIRVNLTAISNP